MTIDPALIKPLKNFSKVQIASTETETSSGIVLSESHTNATPVMGTVIEAGPESNLVPGNIVFFRRYAVDELKVISDNGEQSIFFITDKDLVAYYGTNEKKGWYNKVINLIFK